MNQLGSLIEPAWEGSPPNLYSNMIVNYGRVQERFNWQTWKVCVRVIVPSRQRREISTNMYYVYILRSVKNKKIYIGYCSDINIRLVQHNSGKTRSTKSGIPWKIIYTETFSTRQDAYRRERQMKSYKGGEAFKKLWKGAGAV